MMNRSPMPGTSSMRRRGSAGPAWSAVVAKDIAAHQGMRGRVPIRVASTSPLAAITAQVSSERSGRRGALVASDVDMACDLYGVGRLNRRFVLLKRNTGPQIRKLF